MRLPCLQAPLIWHYYLFCAILGILGAVWAIPAAICLLSLLLLQRSLWSLTRFSVCLLCFLIPCWHVTTHFISAYQTIANSPAILQGNQRICAQIRNVQGLPDMRLRLLLDNLQVADQHLPGLAAWTWDSPILSPLAGMTMCISQKLRPSGSYNNQHTDTWLVQDVAKGIYWRIWSKGNAGEPEFSGKPFWYAAHRVALRDKFMSALAPQKELTQPAAILLALLFGDRYYLQHETVGEFARATIAHSLALSGQHLGIVCLMALGVVTVAGWIFPRIYLYKPRRVLVFACSVPLAFLYLWLGNAPPSLLRATGMLALLAIWQWRSATFTSGDLLCAAVGCILLCNPFLVFDVGFELSVLCVGLICIWWPMIHRAVDLLQASKRSVLATACSRALVILLISLVIQVFLLPFTLLIFHMAGFWFFINLLWLPLLGAITLPGAVAALLFAALGWLPVAHFAVGLAELPPSMILLLLNWLYAHGWLQEPSFLTPYWTMLPAFLLAALGLVCLWGSSQKRRAKILLATGLLFMLPPPILRMWPQDGLTIDALDIGQAQSIAVTLPDGRRLLVDGGGSNSPRFDPGEAIAGPFLTDNHSPTLAAVFNTHPDIDHLGGLFHILDGFRCKAAFHNGREARHGAQARWQRYIDKYRIATLTAGDIIKLGPDLRMEVLHPPAGEESHWQGNSASLVLRLIWREHGVALFPGDAGNDALRKLVASGVNLNADVVFAPHHGSDKNLLPKFYEAVGPKLVIACCGRHNRWHYPGVKLSAYLERKNIPLLNTGKAGRIQINFRDVGRLGVITWAPPGPKQFSESSINHCESQI